MRKSLIFNIGLVAIIVSLCIGISLVGAKGTVLLKWRSPITQNLYDVHMISTDDGWAVGNGGTIIHWNGLNWVNWTDSPTPNNLNSVFMVSTDDGWAVGDSGTIIRWIENEWIPELHTLVITPLLTCLTLLAVLLARTMPRKGSIEPQIEKKV